MLHVTLCDGAERPQGGLGFRHRPIMDASASLGLPIDATASSLFNNPLLVSVHVTDALWTSVNDAYVNVSCTITHGVENV